MSKLQLVFSPRAKERLSQIAEYLSGQGLPDSFVVEYLNQGLSLQSMALEYERFVTRSTALFIGSLGLK